MGASVVVVVECAEFFDLRFGLLAAFGIAFLDLGGGAAVLFGVAFGVVVCAATIFDGSLSVALSVLAVGALFVGCRRMAIDGFDPMGFA